MEAALEGKRIKKKKVKDQKKKSLVFGKKKRKSRIEKKNTCQGLSKPCFFVHFAAKTGFSILFLLIRILMSMQALGGMSPWGWLVGLLAGWLDQKKKSILSHQNPDQKKKKIPAPASAGLVLGWSGLDFHRFPTKFLPFTHNTAQKRETVVQIWFLPSRTSNLISKY